MFAEPGPASPAVDLKVDSHVHTSLCNHASGSMEEYVLAAIKKGLKTIVFLEHLEAGVNYFERTWLTEADFSYYFEEGERLREQYVDLISIKLGVEVGFNPLAIDTLQERLARYPWDRIGLSYHFFFNGTQHLNMVSRRQQNIDALVAVGPDKVITGYFSGLIQALHNFEGQVICHMDAVLRHYPGLQFNASHWDQIDQLLSIILQKNMRLEINTSGYALRNEPYPDRRILCKAIQLGIPLTAGSDAHRPEQVGRYFERLPQFLSELGKPISPDAPNHIKPTA